MGFLEGFNQSAIGRYFALEARGTNVLSEVRSGCVAFLTICYIIAVNPSILADSGGPCTSDDCTGPDKGEFGCRFTDPGFANCVREVKVTLISATCLASAISCCIMGIAANLPFALAPGMGINAYFTYTVVGFYGTGMITYGEAMAAIFVEAWIFIFISVTGVRARLIEMVPKHIMLATAVGIGFFLTFIGLQTNNGIGAISYDSATIVTIGGCPLANRLHQYTPPNVTFDYICAMNSSGQPLVDPFSGAPTNLGPPSGTYFCESQRFKSPTMWLGISGGAIIVLLMIYNTKAAIMYGVLFVTGVSWIPNTPVSYLSNTGQYPGGEERWDYFSKGVTLPTFSKTFWQYDWSGLSNGDAWSALATFLYLDFLDATGTMFSMAKLISHSVPGFMDERGRFPRRIFALCTDGFSILIGSMFGLSPLTVVAESAVGINEGGKTGIMAITLGIGFAISMFLSPIFASIPGYATGPALVVVGSMLMAESLDIDWHRLEIGFPSFITIVFMPLTYSIAYGVLGGLGTAFALWLLLTLIEVCSMPFTKRTLRDITLTRFSTLILAFGCCCKGLQEEVDHYRDEKEVEDIERRVSQIKSSLEMSSGLASLVKPELLEKPVDQKAER